jgi:hypothetical protein
MTRRHCLGLLVPILLLISAFLPDHATAADGVASFDHAERVPVDGARLWLLLRGADSQLNPIR